VAQENPVAGTPSQDDDQLARFGHELRDGSWLENARQRSRRRKSPWNLLLPLFGFPLWIATGFLLGWGASVLHAIVHPNSGPLFTDGPLRLNQALVLFPGIFVSLCPAMLLTNFLVYLIPPARRAMDAEDRGHRGVDYRSSQRALSKIGIRIGLAGLPFMLIGALLA
jgi:hypothetical protein